MDSLNIAYFESLLVKPPASWGQGWLWRSTLTANDFEELVKDVLGNEFKTLNWSLYHDAHRRIEIDSDALSIVVRITDSGMRYYLCIAISLEFREDTPANELPIKVRDFVKKTISSFAPNNYSVPKDGSSCELWMLRKAS